MVFRLAQTPMDELNAIERRYFGAQMNDGPYWARNLGLEKRHIKHY